MLCSNDCLVSSASVFTLITSLLLTIKVSAEDKVNWNARILSSCPKTDVLLAALRLGYGEIVVDDRDSRLSVHIKVSYVRRYQKHIHNLSLTGYISLGIVRSRGPRLKVNYWRVPRGKTRIAQSVVAPRPRRNAIQSRYEIRQQRFTFTVSSLISQIEFRLWHGGVVAKTLHQLILIMRQIM